MLPEIKDSEIYWIHPDHLGSSSVLTNVNGEISNWYEYMPFGEPLMELTTGAYNNPYKYNGKETDSQTGLHYYGARYYDSQRSFWLSVDPLVEETMSPYVYTYNNPVNFIDPDGKKAIRWPPKDFWQAMHYDDIMHLHAKISPEVAFENLFSRYYKKNSSQSYTRPIHPITTRFGKSFKPDGISKYAHGYVLFDGGGLSVKYKDNISLFEITTAKKNVGSLSIEDKKGQIKAGIDHLYEAPQNRSISGYRTFFDKQGRYNLVTLPEITDISEIESYGSQNKVDVRQYIPYFRLNEKGNVDIEFRQRKTNMVGEQSDERLPWIPIENSMPNNLKIKGKL